jgi:hypothetical protein
MPLLFFGFLFVMLFWLFWAMVWAAALLFWPVTLLIAGALLWRTTMRRRLASRPAATSRSAAHHNSAFEEYRRETMARLDEESAKFREFLERLRKSRDKREFDGFMAARRSRPAIEQRGASSA